jgi:hypothetical protein
MPLAPEPRAACSPQVSAMICAVSPSSDQFEETLNTLKYANRAKQMSPPQAPQRNVRQNHPVDEKVRLARDQPPRHRCGRVHPSSRPLSATRDADGVWVRTCCRVLLM